MLSFLTLAGSISKQKNHFPTRAACITLAAFLSSLHPAAPTQLPLPPEVSTSSQFCPHGISLSINTSEVYLALCLPILPRARGGHDIQFMVQWLNNITIFISIQKLATVGFPKSVKQAVRLTKDHAAAV